MPAFSQAEGSSVQHESKGDETNMKNMMKNIKAFLAQTYDELCEFYRAY